MADNNNLEIVISASDQASAMLESINAKLDKLAKGAEDTEAPVKSLGERFDELTGNLESATQPLADITNSILAFDAAVVGLAAVLGSKAIEETAKFEESLYLVQKQLGDTGPSLEKAKADIEAVALAYGTNANTVAESTASFLAAGYDYEAAAQLVDSSTQLMIAGELDAAVATDAITSSLAGFKVPANEAADASVKIGDVLNKIGDISSGAFTEIVDGFKTIAPTAKDAGMSMEETAAAIATIVDTGYSGSEAANALKSGLVQLVDPPSDAREALKALGVELTDSNGKQKLAGEIMGDLAGKYAGLTEEQKLQTAAVIFGKDQAGKLNALLGDWGKSQDYVSQMLDKTTGAVGSMAKEVEGKMALLTTAIDQANEAWRQALESFGAQINAEGSVNAFYEALQNLGVALKNVINTGALDPLVEAYQGAYEQLAEITNDIAKNLPEALAKIDWSQFQAAIGDLGDSFGNLFADIDLSTPEGLAEVIQTLVDVGANLINTTSGIVDGLKPLFDIIGAVVKVFAELDPEVASAAGYLLGLATTVNTLSGVFGSFSSAITGIGKLISGAGGLISGFTSLNPVITAAATALAAFKVGEWFAEWSGLNKVTDAVVTSFLGVEERATDASESIAKMDAKLKEISQTTGVTVGTMDELDQAIADGRIVVDATTGAYRNFTDYLDDWGSTAGFASESAITLAEKMRESGEMSEEAFNKFMAGDKSLESLWATMDKTSAGMQTLDKATKDITKTAAYWGEALDAVRFQFEKGNLTQAQYAAAVKAIDDAAAKAGVNLVTMADQQGKNAKSTKDMAEASEKFALEWEKILSAERTAIFEASADIQVAQIEADAERAVAAMDMLATSFTNTGDVLSELFGLWSEADSLMDQTQLAEWIEREYEIREQLAQAQIDLINAEIARMEAQTAMLENGGMDITIQSDGLEPELEAFMYKILDRIRVQVAGSYQEFLLGCGA